MTYLLLLVITILLLVAGTVTFMHSYNMVVGNVLVYPYVTFELPTA